MDDPKRSAHELYLTYLTTQSDFIACNSFDMEQKILELREKLHMLVVQFLCTCFPQERFKFQEFPNIILQSSTMKYFEPIKAAEAFTNLESYITLLCIMPWKQEFHQIKKYGGFYQTKIESHIKNADSIFKLIGFTENTAGLLVLTGSSKLELLQYVSFECFVASTECHIIENVWKKVFDRGLNVASVVQLRHQNKGTEDDVLALIGGKSVIKGISENVLDARIVPAGNGKHNKLMSGQSSTEPFRNKLQNYMQTAKKMSDYEDNIPFMDEGVKENEFTPVDFDEQIQASLQWVEGKNGAPPMNENSTPGLKASQEWSFVREGLEKNYGKKYFEGIRKDILEKEQDIKPHSFTGKDRYVKVGVEKPGIGYVNHEIAKDWRKQQLEPGQMNALYSESKDSDYATGTSELFYPPTIDSHPQSNQQSLRKRGPFVANIKQVTEPVLVKGSGVHYQAPDYNRQSRTEPILRRQTGDQTKIALDPNQQSRQTYAFASTNSGNLENIQKYQKRVSAPLAQMENVVQTKNLPAETSARIPQASQSFSEASRWNTMDGAVTKGSKTIHNIPQRTIPKQVNNVAPQKIVNPEWSCRYCTFFNSPHTDICEMCSKSREPNIETDSPPMVGDTSRVCDHCTLENEKDSTCCHACGQELRRTQTVV